MTWLWFLIGCLATFRLALLVSKEDGPAFIFRKLRKLPKAGSATKEGISCPLCVSLYSSALTTLYFVWTDKATWQDTPLIWLSMSAVAVCLHMKFTKDV